MNRSRCGHLARMSRLRAAALFFFRTSPFLPASTAVFGRTVDRPLRHLKIPLLLTSCPNFLPATVATCKGLIAIKPTLAIGRRCRHLLRHVSSYGIFWQTPRQLPANFFTLSAFPRLAHVESTACKDDNAWQ